MVFIYQLFNKTHRYHIKSLKLFQDIENQKFMGVTSSLTRSEYLAVIKREVANQLKSVPGKSAIEMILKRFDDFITMVD
jgi:predicted nucleic acid-binding protein